MACKGLLAVVVMGVGSYELASPGGIAIPIMMGRSSGDKPVLGERFESDGDAKFWPCDLFLLSQFQFPTDAELGSPSRALNAAASTNFASLTFDGLMWWAT